MNPPSALVRLFEKKGWFIHALARDPSLSKRESDAVCWHYADLCDENAVSRLRHDIIDPIDAVIHCAGTYKLASENSPLVERDLLRDLFDLHVGAGLQLVREMSGLLRRNSNVIFIGSTLARRVGSGNLAYATSKAALETLTRYLAVDLGAQGVAVNTIIPGLIRTSMSAKVFANPSTVGEIVGNTPLGRTGEPTDIANLIASLVEIDSPWLTGETIVVDGGNSLCW